MIPQNLPWHVPSPKFYLHLRLYDAVRLRYLHDQGWKRQANRAEGRVRRIHVVRGIHFCAVPVWLLTQWV